MDPDSRNDCNLLRSVEILKPCSALFGSRRISSQQREPCAGLTQHTLLCRRQKYSVEKREHLGNSDSLFVDIPKIFNFGEQRCRYSWGREREVESAVLCVAWRRVGTGSITFCAG